MQITFINKSNIITKVKNTNMQIIASNCFNLLNLCAIGNPIIENNHPNVDIENNIINTINPIGII